MPIVHVSVWEGFGQDKANTLIRGITGAFGEVNIPSQAVQVVIHEVPKTHWGIGGEPASEKFKDIVP